MTLTKKIVLKTMKEGINNKFSEGLIYLLVVYNAIKNYFIANISSIY